MSEDIEMKAYRDRIERRQENRRTEKGGRRANDVRTYKAFPLDVLLQIGLIIGLFILMFIIGGK